MKKNFILLLLLAPFFKVSAQHISIKKGWKMTVGDNMEWAAPKFDDSGWQAADLNKPWEQQGHDSYDGFGWYRTHLVIPSSLKEKAYLKDSLVLVLASVDDNDEVFLNGKLIGEYGGHKGTIKQGHYGHREYKIAANNPAVLWDKNNVLAIRVYDTGGDGGIYGSDFNIHMADIMEGVEFNRSSDFSYGDKNKMGKSIVLDTKNVYNYAGTLSVKVTDPETGAVVATTKTDAAHFTKGQPFSWWFTFTTTKKQSYNITYVFKDKKTGTEITETETTPYILTPMEAKTPRINGASTFGVRPGHPVLFRIPATGAGTLKYKVQGLPAGLKVSSTGIITGVIDKAGDYPLVFSVSNNYGTATKKFVLSIGNKIGLTPALLPIDNTNFYYLSAIKLA